MDHINPWLLLAVSVVCSLVYGIFRNIISKKHVKNDAIFYLLNAVLSVPPIFIFLPAALGEAFSSYTLLLGIVFGAITAGGSILTLSALKIGPMSYTYIITTFACAIPTLSGMLFWNEKISAGGWIGLVLMAVSFLLLTERKSGENKAGGRWLLMTLGAFLLSGLVGVLQKVHQSSPHRSEDGMLLLIAFVVSAVLSLVAYLVLRGRIKPKDKKAGLPSAVWAMTLLCGVLFAFCNQINLYLAGAMDSAVFFPIVNGGGVVLSTVAAIILFGERMPTKRALGLGAGILSVLMVSGLFG